MATFQIRDIAQNLVVMQYEGTEKMVVGGPWSDVTKFDHVEVPDNLDPDSVKMVTGTEQAKDDQGNLLYDQVPQFDQQGRPLMVQAKDEQGHNVVDEHGDPVMIQQTTREPRMVPFMRLEEDATLASAKIVKIKTDTLKKIRDTAEAKLSAVVAQYPTHVRLSFPIKRDLAYRWDAMDSTAKTAALNSDEFVLLSTEAAQGGTLTKTKMDTLVAAVLVKAKGWETYCGTISGLLSKAVVDITAITGTLAEVKAACSAYTVNWPADPT